MLRPLRKANAETRRVLNKALKTEAHSPLCKLYIYIYIYINLFNYIQDYIKSVCLTRTRQEQTVFRPKKSSVAATHKR